MKRSRVFGAIAEIDQAKQRLSTQVFNAIETRGNSLLNGNLSFEPLSVTLRLSNGFIVIIEK